MTGFGSSNCMDRRQPDVIINISVVLYFIVLWLLHTDMVLILFMLSGIFTPFAFRKYLKKGPRSSAVSGKTYYRFCQRMWRFETQAS